MNEERTFQELFSKSTSRRGSNSSRGNDSSGYLDHSINLSDEEFDINNPSTGTGFRTTEDESRLVESLILR